MLTQNDTIDLDAIQKTPAPPYVEEIYEEAYLNPGPELDHIIARKIMGWHLDERKVVWRDSAGKLMADKHWSPSIDLNHAWEVWKRLPLSKTLQIAWSEGEDDVIVVCGGRSAGLTLRNLPVMIGTEEKDDSFPPIFIGGRFSMACCICAAALVALAMVEHTKFLTEDLP